jgi:hypothetical protein
MVFGKESDSSVPSPPPPPTSNTLCGPLSIKGASDDFSPGLHSYSFFLSGPWRPCHRSSAGGRGSPVPWMVDDFGPDSGAGGGGNGLEKCKLWKANTWSIYISMESLCIENSILFYG